jgi:DNA polymerase-4
MGWLCRDCLSTGTQNTGDIPPGCPDCRSTRIIDHNELHDLSIAHIDCDAFYATVEKRDDPSLKDKPVLVGGGSSRGVIMAACYVARRYGCRSAMPMFKARKLCPDAIVVRPNMAKYSEVGRAVRALMLETTPLVEPISIDEAFLDLSGTEKLHKGSAARTLAGLASRIEQDIGITVTVGLSHNKFLAKIASNLDKPRGFSVIGQNETLDFLSHQPVSKLWGVGRALQQRLTRDGLTEIGQLRKYSEEFLVKKYGSIGHRLSRFSRGEDSRRVDPQSNRKSISSETTFFENLADPAALKERLWPLCEKVAFRAKASDLSGGVVTVKLKTGDFRIRTRSRTLPDPTQLAEVIWRYASDLLEREATGTSFRLIGVGLSALGPGIEADPMDLADPDAGRRKVVEQTMDSVRARFGAQAIRKGRTFRGTSRLPKE